MLCTVSHVVTTSPRTHTYIRERYWGRSGRLAEEKLLRVRVSARSSPEADRSNDNVKLHTDAVLAVTKAAWS